MVKITLFNFWHNGDVINFTAFPRLIKERLTDVHLKVCVNDKHKMFLATNPFVDELVGVDRNFASQYADKLRYSNEDEIQINTWPCVARPPEEVRNFFSWDVFLETAKLVNKGIGQKIITEKDNLLPELFFTEEEKTKAKEFAAASDKFGMLELECFSGQFKENTTKIIQNVAKELAAKQDFKLFLSFLRQPVNKPFYSLNKYNLRMAALISQYADVFFGISSGITVASFERTLNEPKKRIIAYPNNSTGPQTYTKIKKYENTEWISVAKFQDSILEYLKNR